MRLKSIPLGIAIPVVLAGLLGIFLGVATRALDWDATTTFVVGLALVAVIALLGGSLVLLSLELRKAAGSSVVMAHHRKDLVRSASREVGPNLAVHVMTAEKPPTALEATGALDWDKTDINYSAFMEEAAVYAFYLARDVNEGARPGLAQAIQAAAEEDADSNTRETGAARVPLGELV